MGLVLLKQVYSIARRFIGASGELRADSSNWALILDDGATEGGHRFLNVDSNDERYQARSPELDGLLEFEPQDRGILVRRGPADYRVRTLKVNVGNLKLTNPQGHQGDPLFELAETIESAHIFDGIQTFTQPIKADGGLQGDVVGNVTGDVTGDLVGDSTGKHTGSVDTRGAALLLDPGQIARGWLDESTRHALVPAGCIIMWWGQPNEVPAGWLLCNGTQGTPDLRDRFVVGAGGELDVGDFGGATQGGSGVIQTSPAGAHSHGGATQDHALTVEQIPPHSHNVPNGAGGAGIESGRGNVNVQTQTSQTGGGQGHSHNISEAPNHTHELDLAFDIIPPYFALCYIMKGIG